MGCTEISSSRCILNSRASSDSLIHELFFVLLSFLLFSNHHEDIFDPLPFFSLFETKIKILLHPPSCCSKNEIDSSETESTFQTQY